MASPIAYSAHYGLLMTVYVAIFFVLWRERPKANAYFWALAVSYLLSTNYYAVADLTAPTHLNFLQSYLFFAALIALVSLYFLRRHCCQRLTPIRSRTEELDLT